jgi:hypothetical protein
VTGGRTLRRTAGFDDHANVTSPDAAPVAVAAR